MSADERTAELEALVAQMREQITALLAEIAGLRAQLAKDSHNISKPPSSDGLRRSPRSHRQPPQTAAAQHQGHDVKCDIVQIDTELVKELLNVNPG